MKPRKTLRAPGNMNNHSFDIEKKRPQTKILAIEVAGFTLAALVCWVTELLDPPFSIRQVSIQTAVILVLGIFTIYWSTKFTARIRELRGFLVICAACKKVRIDDEWISIEHFISSKSDLMLSHSTCPECTERLYGEFLHKK